tara:strand:- start:21015 stop:21866 length:852 start_codon:yes stop_codon:yes gene_type:complete
MGNTNTNTNNNNNIVENNNARTYYKLLYIPDYVSSKDMERIKDYFYKFNIAIIDNVYVYRHTEPEYYVNDDNYYGYAIIHVKEWYNTQVAINFYNRLLNNTAKIVYNDPEFWNISLLKIPIAINRDTDNVLFDNLLDNSQCNFIPQQVDNIDDTSKDDTSIDESSDYCNITTSIDEIKKNHTDETSDDNDIFKFDEELLNTEFENTLETGYEGILNKQYKKYNKHFNKHKRKFNEEVTKLKNENIELSNMLIRNNKNYLKNNRKRQFKNTWNRRLRVKYEPVS